MTERPTRKCNKVNCTEVGQWEGGYCPAHAKQQGARRQQSRHGFETNDSKWRKFVDVLRGLGNFICQSVDSFGVRCSSPVWGFHHILEVSARPDVAVHPENVVGVCMACHNKAE